MPKTEPRDKKTLRSSLILLSHMLMSLETKKWLNSTNMERFREIHMLMPPTRIALMSTKFNMTQITTLLFSVSVIKPEVASRP